ncbi:MAG: NADH-quinone oxidoreductase subunit D [FCB group bacterium]|nr:NADH-quinone oxidoreductase subunit D [FCB group bacterium]
MSKQDLKSKPIPAAAWTEDLPIEEMWLNMGPSHPTTHGLVRIKVKIRGELIVDADVEIGYLHRAFEKMCETHTWNQCIIYTDRLNYVSPIINNVGFCLGVEKLLGIEVPRRGQYWRTLMCEISRVADHLTCIGPIAMELGAMTVFLYTMKAREYMYDLIEAGSGARITTNFSRVGGVRFDMEDGFPQKAVEGFKEVRKVASEVDRLLTKNRIFYDRTRNMAVVTKDEAISLGFTGPLLRASGVPYDIRRDKPYLVYDEVDFAIPLGTRGDVMDRYLVRLEEIEQSIRICEQLMMNMPDGPVNVDDPAVFLPPKEQVYGSIEGLMNHFKLIMDGHGIRPPIGEVYQAVEAGNGELGFYIVSDGSDHPYRVRCRPPCFHFTAALKKMVIGGMIADVVPAFGSINMIGGELDR